jgi:hypothetical protein
MGTAEERFAEALSEAQDALTRAADARPEQLSDGMQELLSACSELINTLESWYAERAGS